jgi:hypothetical protein
MKKVIDLERLAKLLNIKLIDIKDVLDKINSSSCDEVCEHTQ